MKVSVIKTGLPDVLVLESSIFGDERGFFYESFNAKDFKLATGLNSNFVQDNHSKSSRGVLRGLHYQINQPQGKLVRVVQGAIYDVAVDIRKGSETFGKWVGVELSAENKRQLWVPENFAHGFLVISQFAEVLYKATDYYAPQHERSIRWDDPDIAVHWPQLACDPVLSAKDAVALSLKEAELPVFEA